MSIRESHNETRRLLRYIGQHARTVVRRAQMPEGALVPDIKLCEVCQTPAKAPWDRCYACHKETEAWGEEMADIVVPLSYAVKSYEALQQFYYDLHQYKRDPKPSLPAQKRLMALIQLFRMHHLGCLEEAAEAKVSMVLPVPSGRDRKNHPLPMIANGLGLPVISATYTGPPRESRATEVELNHYKIGQRLQGHVLVLEDTWVTGRNAQVIAIQARRAGAEYVSIVVLARMLDYGFPPTKGFVDSWDPDARWSTQPCPVTGSKC